MPLANGEVFAGYQILRPLGFGGMGEVYLVQHPRLPRQDALKILPADMSASPEFRARFNREAELVASLYNPHIVGIHDRGEYKGQLWISMDYIDGPDAGRLLRDHYPGGMPPREVVDIVVAVADALDYAHTRGLLHRDVKPPNILLTNPERGRRRIVLADFGIARDAAETTGLTETNMTVGTVNYASPEQLTGAPLDGRADQYGLAATAYHLLTGSPMFGSSNPAVVIGRHLNSPPPRLTDVRLALAPLDPVLSRALSKNAADRFPSCTEFANALRVAAEAPQNWAAAEASRHGIPGRPPAGASDRPSHDQHTAILPAQQPGQMEVPARSAGAAPPRWPWALAGVALLLILAALVVAIWPRQQQSGSSASGTVTSTSPPAVASATTPSRTTTVSTSTSTSASMSASSLPSTAATTTFESMRDLVNRFYGQLPGNPRAAWSMLDTNYQQRNGLDGYLGFWSTIQSVSLLSVAPRDSSSVVATIRYVLPDGRVDTENRWLSVVPRGAQLLIYDSERIGPA